MGLTVAVTGPTGEIGIAAVTALEREPAVERIVGMARRPFDPAAHGWIKTTYQQGDILDRDAVGELVADADVVIHLAFIIMGSREESARINLQGTRNVFEATVAAGRGREEQKRNGPRRLVYTSSVAAYGYHPDNPVPITEDVPTRGSAEHYYSQQKAACEAALAEITEGSPLEVFVLRPCIVAGPNAPALADAMPWNQLPSSGAHDLQIAAGVEAGGSGSGVPIAARPPRRRRRGHRVGRGRARTAGCLQHRRRRIGDRVGCREGTRRPARSGSGGRGIGGVGGAVAVAVHPVGARVAARGPDVGGDGHVPAKKDLGWRPTHTSAETLAALAAAM